MTTFHAELAWLPGGLDGQVRIEVDGARITSVVPRTQRRTGDIVLSGVVLPGFANAHSHAFHRALRGRTHDDGGTFWTWRERMYAVAARLDPDSYFALARATFAEMALSGITCVGEFHYLHHAPGGVQYADPNAMGAALVAAAREAGVRITLLDTCYLAGGLSAEGHLPLDELQTRFGDGDAERWAARRAALGQDAHVRIGAAVHSVRAVPREQLPVVVGAAAGQPLHVHVSEQPAENEQCTAYYGTTPTALLAGAGVLGPGTTAVHATHLSADDIARLASSTTSIAMCPTTERDLADGVGPARALRDAGCPIVLGTDQHAMLDMIEEARALELDERMVSGVRGKFSADELVAALSDAGHRALGWPDAGRIEVGARADLVAVGLDSVRTAGIDPSQVLFAASAADVHTVLVDGAVVVADGRHTRIDVARELRSSIGALWA